MKKDRLHISVIIGIPNRPHHEFKEAVKDSFQKCSEVCGGGTILKTEGMYDDVRQYGFEMNFCVEDFDFDIKSLKTHLKDLNMHGVQNIYVEAWKTKSFSDEFKLA